jgi:hypothetical protein
MKTITLSLLLLLNLPTFAQNGECQVNWKMHIKPKYRKAIAAYAVSISEVANPTNTFDSKAVKQMGIFLIDYNPDSLGFETLIIRPCFDESWQEFMPDSYFFMFPVAKPSWTVRNTLSNAFQQGSLCLVYNQKTKQRPVDNESLKCWKDIVQDRVYERKPDQLRMQLPGNSRPWGDSTFVKEHLHSGYILDHSAPVGYTNDIRIFRKRTGERIIRFKKDSEEYSVREY